MAQLRIHLNLHDLAARHAAGESLRSLAAASGTTVHTLSRQLKRFGYNVRSRTEASVLENHQRPQGKGSRGGSTAASVYKCRRKKIAMIRDYRAAHGCSDCGENHPACLDLHHLDPSTKDPRLGKIKGRRWDALSFADIETELQKCIVLCSNCHKKRHWAETPM